MIWINPLRFIVQKLDTNNEVEMNMFDISCPIATQKIVLDENVLNEDFLTSLIKQENEKLRQDVEQYDYDSYISTLEEEQVVQERQVIENKATNKGRRRLEPEGFRKAKEILESYTIHESIIKVDNKTLDGINNLRKEILKNREDKQIHYYIVKGEMKKAANEQHKHYFLTIQDKTKISVIDSMGDEREDFFKCFVFESNLQGIADEKLRFIYTRNSAKLQYSSGVCEIYAIKMAFYIARAHIFNSLSRRFTISNNLLVKRKGEDTYNLDPVFQNGLTEKAFGMQIGGVCFFQGRLLIIDEQINKLSSTNDGKQTAKQKDQEVKLSSTNDEKQAVKQKDQEIRKRLLYYSAKKGELKTFEDIFISDLQKSKKLLVDLYREFSTTRDDFLKVILQNRDIQELNKNSIIEDSIKKIYDKIFDNRQIFIAVDDDYKAILTEEERHELSKEDFDKVIRIINDTLYDRRYDGKDSGSRERLKQLNESLLKLDKMDFLNPYTSIKAGHMYFETLDFKQKLQQRQQEAAAAGNINMVSGQEQQQ